MYRESTNCNEVVVDVTTDISSLDVIHSKVSYNCNKIRTKMTVYSDLTVEENFQYFLRYYFLKDATDYRLY